MTIVEISELIGLIVAGLGLLGTIFGWVRTILKEISEKKLQKKIEELMIEAEQFDISGAEKQKYVIEEMIKYTKELRMSIVDIVNKTKEYIEECIDFSKKVNAKK